MNLNAKLDSGWTYVTEESPCGVCGKTDWCSRSDPNPYIVNCRREKKHPTTGEEGRQTKDGSAWTYWLDGYKEYSRTQSSLPEPTVQPTEEKGDADLLHRMYSRLLDEFALNDEHRVKLRNRGLTGPEVDELVTVARYSSLSVGGRAKACAKFIAEGLEADMAKTPGFRVKKGDDGKQFWSLAGYAGMMVPVRDAEKRIVGIQIRADKPKDSKKRYSWLSSKKGGGPSPGTPIHAPALECNGMAMRVTEGPLKADIVTLKTGAICVGLPGVGSWRKAKAAIRKRKPSHVIVAFDADYRTTPSVLNHLKRFLRDATTWDGVDVQVEKWDLEDGKGIDDLLLAGKQPESIAAQNFLDQLDDIQADADDDEKASAADVDANEAAGVFLLGYHIDDVCRLRFYRGDFIYWQRGRYKILQATDARAMLVDHLRNWYSYVNPGFTNAVLDIVKAACWMDPSTQQPAWLGSSKYPPHECLPTRNQILHLPTMHAEPATPKLFVTASSDCDLVADAPRPDQWLKFLGELWGDDAESIALLQEWFGYCLTPDTSQQKIILLIGPKRSGKGTIGRALTALVGRDNVAGPTLASFATNFGLSALLDKSLAIVSDARLSGRTDKAIVLERMLSISGEDAITIDRKHREPVTARLPTRLMVISNELPKLIDESGAFESRFLMLRLRKTFLGHEDHQLEHKLHAELPSILLWSIAGWQRLRQRGHFLEPASSVNLRDQFRRISAPVADFIEECCEIGSDYKALKDSIYDAYTAYCDRNNRKHVVDKSAFGRDLLAASPEIDDIRLRAGGARVRYYTGIRLIGS